MATLSEDLLVRYPPQLTVALAREAELYLPARIYIAGGTVRDWLLGRPVNDLDITVPNGGIECAGRVAEALGAAFVLLDQETDVARVVWQGLTIDFSGFRDSTKTIEADLSLRDFTINSMAVALSNKGPGLSVDLNIIDPCGGLGDLEKRIIKATHQGGFVNDPLRILRAYRFAATLDFTIDSATNTSLTENVALLDGVSPERLAMELDLIMANARASTMVAAMAESGVLGRLFPELTSGIGISQPSSHHLDVFGHGLAALEAMENLLAKPEDFFKGHGEKFRAYLDEDKRRLWLKWAALFHDLGKTEVREIRADKGDRITFYNHDRTGAVRFSEIARRLKWSRKDEMAVARFIKLHMYPFHLSNSRRRTGLTPKAYLRLVKAVGVEMEGLFLLAMADSLASLGPNRPADMEESLVSLYAEASRVVDENIAHVLAYPPLVTGHDLIAMGLSSGPLFREIFEALEVARVEGEVTNRDQALQWVGVFVSKKMASKATEESKDK